jgi:hypothetical protein
MQIAATSLQLLGVFITLIGLFYAWNRASGRFDEWLDSVKSTLNQFRGKLTRATGAIGAELVVKPEVGASASVRHPGEPDERLSRIENTLSELPGKFNTATEAAITEALAEFDATGKGIAVKDIYWALRGIGVQVLGYALSLYDQLVR